MVVPKPHCDTGRKMDIDKILEQLLMPPPASTPRSLAVMNSVESLRDASGSSLDRSNNSSSTNSSWLSDSSCSCHSMSPRTRNTKSTFVFHKQAILPPLLCSASRTEMRMYRVRAMEKDQKKKQKEKERLISRVEAILSSVAITPAKVKPPRQEEELITPEIPDDMQDTQDENLESAQDESTEESTDTNTVEKSDRTSGGDDIIINDDVTSFHDNAYRSSLRNLLQKSMNLDTSKQVVENSLKEETPSSNSTSESEDDVTGNTVVNIESKSPENNTSTANSSSDSENTVPSPIASIQTNLVHVTEVAESLIESVLENVTAELSKQNGIQLSHHNDPCYVTDMADNMDRIPAESTNSNHQNITLRQEKLSEDTSVWQTPKVLNAEVEGQDSPLDVTSSQFFDLHNQSTSTKLNFPTNIIPGSEVDGKKLVDAIEKDIDQSPILQNKSDNCDTTVNDDVTITGDVIELTGALCYDTTLGGTNLVLHKCSVSMTTDSASDDLTMLQPVSSNSDVTMSTVTLETQNMVEAYKEQLEDEETSESNSSSDSAEVEEEPLETGPLSALKRSSSFTLDRPSESFESAVIEAVSQHFQGLSGDPKKLDGKPTKDSEIAAAKKKRMLHARVRRGSYTLDEPSPYLVKHREEHVITPGGLDDDVCSETTDGTAKDVKRRLDLPSDSEESSVALTERKKKTRPQMAEQDDKKDTKMDVEGQQPPVEDDDVLDLCRLLQDQHRNQLESMKKKHQEQLESLKQEFIQEHTKMSLPLDGSKHQLVLPPLDMTVSPSLASTEYHDIAICRELSDEYLPEQHLTVQDATKVTSMVHDVTSVTNTEMTSSLHVGLCKLSALCKGHLTRQLLRSNKVQEIMQVVRDTSRLILSLRIEKTADSLTDTALEDRLYNQLRSALYSFHDMFFALSSAEQMYVIRQSNYAEKIVADKAGTKTHKLSTATQKSLERKKLLSSTDLPLHPAVSHGKSQPKEVKSKISHIWKAEPAKPAEKKVSSAPHCKVTSQSKKTTSQKPKVTSQSSKAKSPTVMSQNRKVTSLIGKPAVQNGRIPAKPKPTSPVGYMKSQPGKVTSQPTKAVNQNCKMASQRKGLKKPSPLSNRVNIDGRATTA